MVQQASRPLSPHIDAAVVCRHHWIIEEPVGPVSIGVCQQCSEVREFKNYIESAPWGEDSTASQPPAGLLDDSTEEPEEPEDI